MTPIRSRPEVRSQRRLRLVQTTVLVGALLLLTVRALGTVFGPRVSWIGVLLMAGAAIHAVRHQRVALPPGSRRLDAREAPQLVQIVAELAARAGLSVAPSVYLLPSHVANAVTTGPASASIIVVTTELLRRLSPRELRAVLAHEVAHIRNNDLILFAVTGALQHLTAALARILLFGLIALLPLLMIGGAVVPLAFFLFLGGLPIVSLVLQFAVLRTREFQADITAVELCADPMALASALQRLEQPVLGWFGWLMAPYPRRRVGQDAGLAALFRTHPPTRERLERLHKML